MANAWASPLFQHELLKLTVETGRLARQGSWRYLGLFHNPLPGYFT